MCLIVINAVCDPQMHLYSNCQLTCLSSCKTSVRSERVDRKWIWMYQMDCVSCCHRTLHILAWLGNATHAHTGLCLKATKFPEPMSQSGPSTCILVAECATNAQVLYGEFVLWLRSATRAIKIHARHRPISPWTSQSPVPTSPPGLPKRQHETK